MSVSKLSGLHPQVKAAAEWGVRFLAQHGYSVTVTSGYRDIAKQTELYRNRAKNPNPVAAPGNSAHNYGLAFDLARDKRTDAAALHVFTALGFAKIVESTALHFEVPGWRQLVGK